MYLIENVKLFNYNLTIIGIDIVEPTDASLSKPRSSPPLILPVVENKNDQSTSISEDLLLEKVAPSLRSKGKLLLEAFNQNPQQLIWNDAGEITINEETLPNANILQLFPAVFKTSVIKNKTLPGFIEFVNQIAAMGLGHLISPKLLRGFKRKEKIQNQVELYNQIIKNDKWYFLGPI